jgi:transposase
MFLRRHRKTVDDVCYEYWTLCEAVRTPAGPRQRVVATLGKLEGEAPAAEAGWEDLDYLLTGTRHARQPDLFEGRPDSVPAAASGDAGRWELADLENLRVERVRDFGESFLALALWRRLGLEELLAGLIEEGKEDVPWPTIASILTVARFCGQPSELGIAEHWYQRNALEDILGVGWEKINDDRLYRGLDALGAQKDQICAHLMKRYEDWFGVRFEFLLYDVTSTFFEGKAEENEKAARGFSRDGRPDCKQVCIGLVCTPEGLPLSFEVFKGNRKDGTTVEEIVTAMEQKYGKCERIWIMDRGMVSAENLAFLRRRKARYLLGTPRSELKAYEALLLEKDGWQEVQSGVEARLMAHADGKGEERYVLCRSTARAEKENAMLRQQSERLCAQLAKIDAALRGKAQANIEAVGRRIGRWLGQYPAAARIIEVLVERDAEGRACALNLSSRIERGQWAHKSRGTYLLRTNCIEEDPALLWQWYIQLTQAEAAFRTAKSDLGLRPVFHRMTHRVEAHILVCFLALALWRVLEMWMQGKGLGTCARKLIGEIATIKSMDVIVPVKRGDAKAEVRVRTVARPDKRVSELLVRLGLELPARNKILRDAPFPESPPPAPEGEM